jgi:hypothetical protein
MRPPPRLATKTRGGNTVQRPASIALRTTIAAACIEGGQRERQRAGGSASAGAGRSDPAETECSVKRAFVPSMRRSLDRTSKRAPITSALRLATLSRCVRHASVSSASSRSSHFSTATPGKSRCSAISSDMRRVPEGRVKRSRLRTLCHSADCPPIRPEPVHGGARRTECLCACFF